MPIILSNIHPVFPNNTGPTILILIRNHFPKFQKYFVLHVWKCDCNTFSSFLSNHRFACSTAPFLVRGDSTEIPLGETYNRSAKKSFRSFRFFLAIWFNAHLTYLQWPFKVKLFWQFVTTTCYLYRNRIKKFHKRVLRGQGPPKRMAMNGHCK